ncbi:MAG: lytic murein transglycosylase, partial [Alphaproteobacteria bacterium]
MPERIEGGDFLAWLDGPMRARAREGRISEAILDRTRPHIAFRPDVLERQAGQTEFTRPIRDYLDITTSEDRIRKGRRALREHRALFNALETRFGVESEIVAAIWGIETGYGTIRG